MQGLHFEHFGTETVCGLCKYYAYWEYLQHGIGQMAYCTNTECEQSKERRVK